MVATLIANKAIGLDSRVGDEREAESLGFVCFFFYPHQDANLEFHVTPSHPFITTAKPQELWGVLVCKSNLFFNK